ncbi:MAG: DUF922 domain-containing protein [Deltaproteobacteria bacterium]|nr:DUF922 domain-containing protein [Deltaproteobacteria bacterium]
MRWPIGIAVACFVIGPSMVPARADVVTVRVPVVTSQSSRLLFQWRTRPGALRSASSVAHVPVAVRREVRVIPLDGDAPPAGTVYVVDLRRADRDGRYRVSLAPAERFLGRGRGTFSIVRGDGKTTTTDVRADEAPTSLEGLSRGDASYPEPDVATTVEFYDVNGSSLAELRREVRAKGPYFDDLKKRVMGLTKSRISWNRPLRRERARCVVTQPAARARFTIVLPRWVGASTAPSKLRTHWDAFVAGVKAHEEMHRQIHLDGVQATLKGIAGLTARSCEELKRVVAEIVARMKTDTAARNRALDRPAPGQIAHRTTL